MLIILKILYSFNAYVYTQIIIVLALNMVRALDYDV